MKALRPSTCTMLRPGGRPVAVNVTGSPSGSNANSGTLTEFPSLLNSDWNCASSKGAESVTAQLKEVVVKWRPSSARTMTVYGELPTASGLIVPLMTGVVGLVPWIDSPGGRPVG